MPLATALAQPQQQRVNVIRRGTDRTGQRPDNAPIVLEPTAPIANLFARAEEGIARADWKFAIDCLQRIIEEPQDSMVQAPGGSGEGRVLYESARQRAVRRLASLPPEGREAYRLLYDGRAKRLLERGQANHDVVSLATILARYPLTTYADEAADQLSSWALDEGRPAETIRVLTDLIELVPERDVPEQVLYGKLAAAYALLGREQKTAEAIQKLDAADQPLRDAIAELRPHPGGEEEAGRSSWPMSGGTADRQNRMPLVEPTLAAATPWKFALPGADGDPWRRARGCDPASIAAMPVGTIAAADGRLFVRSRWGCTALDASDLSVRWESDDILGVSTSWSAADRMNRRHREAESWTEQIAYEDLAAGAVAWCQGVVTILSREGTNTYAPIRPDLPNQASGAFESILGAASRAVDRGTARSTGIGGNRLIALEAESGKVRWQRGRTGDPDDPLGLVEFAALPVPVHNELWVPYRRFSDLHVAAIDSADGRLLESLPLCALGRPMTSPWFALPPAAADGLIFIPTGRGVLFAIETADRTIRWASQYSTTVPDAPAPEANAQYLWPAGAPVATGGIVLLAPPRQKELYCFAAATGEVLWTAPLGDCHYIVAAHQDHVWVGGRSVSCLSIADGRTVWTAALPATSTGHAVRSGSLIHAPTVEGLVSLRASDGTSVGIQQVPASHGPLGNLLCLHNAMYTINPAQLRMFPDIGRSHADAVARLSASPKDVAAAVRLGWLELLNSDAAGAMRVLDGLAEAVFSGEGAEGDAACQVMVETLLTRAAEVVRDGGDTEALGLLERADRIARSPLDRLRCALAIADCLAAGDRFAEAYRRLWTLGLSPYASQIVPLSNESVGSARLNIARRLSELGTRVPAEQRAEALSEVTAEAEAAGRGLNDASTSRAAQQKLEAIADLAPPGGLRDRAVRSLVAYHRGQGSLETAEQWALRQIGGSAPPVSAIGPLLQTAQIYGELAGFDDRALGAMVHTLDELAARFGAEPLRAVLAAGDGPVSPDSTLKEWINRFLARFPSEALATSRDRLQESPVQLSGQVAWTREFDNNAPRASVVQFSEPRPPLLTDRFVLYTPDDRLACYNADSVDEPVWQTSLRLPGTFESDTSWMRERQEPETKRAVADGQTAVFAGDDGLFAVGLVTGRRLWVRSFEPPGHSNRMTHPDTAIAAGDGLLAAMPRAGRLTLMQLSDGATIWERDLYGEAVHRIWMIGDRIVTSDASFTRVLVMDRRDGGLVERVLFEQPDPDSGLIDVVVSGEVLCGPLAAEDFEGVAAIDLQTGATLWRLPVEKPLAQLFQPRDGFVGISLLGGDVWVVDALSGEVQINRRVAGAQVVVDGMLVDGTLIVQHVNPENEGRLHHLTGLDVATQEEVWRRTDIVPPPKGSRPLKVVHGMIPTFVASLQERGRGSQDVRAALIDPRTGLSVGTMTQLPSVTTATRTVGDFEVFPGAGVAVVVAPNAMFAIRTERIAGSQKGF